MEVLLTLPDDVFDLRAYLRKKAALCRHITMQNSSMSRILAIQKMCTRSMQLINILHKGQYQRIRTLAKVCLPWKAHCIAWASFWWWLVENITCVELRLTYQQPYKISNKELDGKGRPKYTRCFQKSYLVCWSYCWWIVGQTEKSSDPNTLLKDLPPLLPSHVSVEWYMGVIKNYIYYEKRLMWYVLLNSRPVCPNL